MKGYPLIYSRTKNYDFVPDFLARPKDLNVSLALKYVKNAMNNLDFISGIRYTAFPVDNYCVCGGIACISAKLVEKLKVSSIGFLSNYADVNEYLKDCKGRSLACFIGIAIPKSEITVEKIPNISLDKYWDVYYQYLKHQWLSESDTYSEQLEMATIDIPEKRYIPSFTPQIEKYGTRKVVVNFAAHEQQILDYYFHSICNGKNESLITEIQNREEWEALYFDSAVVSETLYQSLKANPIGTLASKKSALSGEGVRRNRNDGEVKLQRTEVPPPYGFNEAQKKTDIFNGRSSNSRLTPIIIAIVILVIILLIVKAIK